MVFLSIFMLSSIFTVINFETGLFISQDPNNLDRDENVEELSLKTSADTSQYLWFDERWDCRISVNVSANGASQNKVPVELIMNFTEYLTDLNQGGNEFNSSSIRVLEYLSTSSYYEVDYEFHKYTYAYDNKTNAVGDMVWIVNGTTAASETRLFFVYFNHNESKYLAPAAPTYPTIRYWHEGFEEMVNGSTAEDETKDLIEPTEGNSYDGQGDARSYNITDTVSARGNKCFNIYGNNWKEIYIGRVESTDNVFITAKIR